MEPHFVVCIIFFFKDTISAFKKISVCMYTYMCMYVYKTSLMNN